jgi:hypothetical protein
VERLERFVKWLEPKFQEELSKLIQEKLVETSQRLLKEYRAKLTSLQDEIKVGTDVIKIDPLQLMAGTLSAAGDISIRKLTKEKKVEDGDEWIQNTDRKWYKPWTWFQEKGYWRTKYKTVKYISADELVQTFFAPIEEGIHENADLAKKHTST